MPFHHPKRDLNGGQIARFPGKFPPADLGANLVLQSVRSYSARHHGGACGSVNCGRTTARWTARNPFFNYRLPDYRGETGIEGKYNSELHGHAGGGVP